MSIASLFITAKIRKQSKYPLTDERRESVAYLYSGILLLLFSHQVVSNSLRLHGLQHATLTAGGLCGLEGHLKLQNTQTCFSRPSRETHPAPLPPLQNTECWLLGRIPTPTNSRPFMSATNVPGPMPPPLPIPSCPQGCARLGFPDRPSSSSPAVSS